MKKLLTLLLTLLMMFTLVGCNSKQEEKPAIDEPQIEEPIVGGYIEVEDKNLTPELIEMFEKAFEGFDGANYTPVMLEVTQVVAGTNYKFKADGTKTTNPMIQGTYYVYINKDLQGNISLLDIEVIEEHELKIFEPEEEIDTKIKQDVTNMSFWVVFYDQYGNELQREALKYGTVPSYKGILPKGFVGWDKSLKAITGNTYIHAICHEVKHEDNNQTQSEETDTKCLKNLDKVLKVIAGGILVHALYHEISRELCKPDTTMYNVTAQVQGSHGKATVKVGSGKPTTKTAQAAKGISLVFTATPEEGYEFDRWEVVSGGIDIESIKYNAEINVTMPGTALTLKAHFKAVVPSEYDIIVEDDGHGTAKAQIDGVDVTSAAPNATVTLVATANDGYAFKKWQIVRGLEASDITDNSFTMPSNEIKVKAIFERVYNITLQTNEHGTVVATVDGNTATTAAATAEVTLTATPDDGYQFKEWKTVSGGVTVTDNKFTMPASNVTVRAVFEAKAPATKTFKAVYNTKDSANTLTFYYDNKDHSGENITVYNNLPTAANNDVAWGYNGVRKEIKKVVITESVKEYSSLTSMACMFHDMTSASSIEGAEYLDVSNVTNMAAMFWNFGSESNTLKLAPEVKNWKTGQVTTMQNMFMNYGAGSDSFNDVPDVSEWDTRNVTNMSKMFCGFASKSKELECAPKVNGTNWNTVEVTDMSGMFSDYGKISIKLKEAPDVSSWNTQKVTKMGDMFLYYGYTSTALDTVPDVSGWNTSSVITMVNMFQNYGYSSTALSTVPNVSNWKTDNVTNMTNMFNGYGYTSTNISCVLDLSEWDLSNITSGDDVFKFIPSAFDVTIPATTGAKFNDANNWYYGDGTNSIAPPTGKIFTLSECIAAGTMISMPGGKQKAVEELEIGDIICTFDHETGEVSSAPVCFIWESKNVGNAFTLTFENDVEVTVIEEHGFYDKEEQKYVFINLQNAEEYIGHCFYNADTNSWLELKNCEALNDIVDAYAIITSGHLNHMSNGMLSMCDGSVKVLANIFEYDEQMKFDEDKKKADIDTYGLTSKEKILELKGFTETDYDIYNLQYVDVMIGKGIITWEWMEALSDYCVANGL